MLSHTWEKIIRHLYYAKTQRTLQKRQNGGRGSDLCFELTLNGHKTKEAHPTREPLETSQAYEADARSLDKQCIVATGSTGNSHSPGPRAVLSVATQ